MQILEINNTSKLKAIVFAKIILQASYQIKEFKPLMTVLLFVLHIPRARHSFTQHHNVLYILTTVNASPWIDMMELRLRVEMDKIIVDIKPKQILE